MAAKFRHMLRIGTPDFGGERDFYRAIPAVIQDRSSSILIRRSAALSRLLRHIRGRGEPILTRILMGP
jgi:hypothetical protein